MKHEAATRIRYKQLVAQITQILNTWHKDDLIEMIIDDLEGADQLDTFIQEHK